MSATTPVVPAGGATMRVSVLHGVGTLTVEERPVPAPDPHQVLVRIASVGVCGSDVHYYEHGRIGRFVVEQPLVLGHEASGVVEAVGSEVTRLTVGQRVSLEPGVPDLACEQCLAGRYNLCTDMRFHATPPIDGSFAELVTIHELFAHPLPDSVSDDAGALLEPLSVAIWACQKAGVTVGFYVNGVLEAGSEPTCAECTPPRASHGTSPAHRAAGAEIADPQASPSTRSRRCILFPS